MQIAITPPTRDDAEAVYALLVASDLDEWGAPDTELEELLETWDEIDLPRDAWLARDEGGRLVGYAEVRSRRSHQVEAWITVHPEHRRQRIGSRLLELVEARAAELVDRAPAGAEVTLIGYANPARPGTVAFAETHGYVPVRRFWRMAIDMEAPPPAPEWPDGITVRTYRPGDDDRATHAAVTEAFGDHWGSTPVPFESWLEHSRGPGFDPELWFLAVDGEEVAGAVMGYPFLDFGWVGSLSVRRAWRRRGLGRALLLRSFDSFWQRGRRRVALGVDSENPTGATGLYESVGMHVDRAHDRYQKVLRAGEPLGLR